MTSSGIPLGQWSGSDATDQLRKAIEKNAADSHRQNRWLVGMTGLILVLTLVITVLTWVLVVRP